MKKTVQITVHGKVQGVFFRASAKVKADELDIHGIVKNLSNGDVYIEVCAEENNLQKFIQWCKYGPQHASVNDIIITEIAPKDFEGFQILRN